MGWKSGQVAFSFPPPMQLDPILPEMEDEEEGGAEGSSEAECS